MKLYRHYYGAKRNVFLEYDFLHTVNGRDELQVRFVRYHRQSADVAETIIPSGGEWTAHGFTEEELAELRSFLQANEPSILQEAESTRDGDANLVEVTFEIEEELWTCFALTCYVQGISPEQGVVQAIEQFIAENPLPNSDQATSKRTT